MILHFQVNPTSNSTYSYNFHSEILIKYFKNLLKGSKTLIYASLTEVQDEMACKTVARALQIGYHPTTQTDDRNQNI